jgi:hypothetical protein
MFRSFALFRSQVRIAGLVRMMGRLIVAEARENGGREQNIGGKMSPFPIMASILPHTRESVANELVVIAPVFAWSARHGEVFRDKK